MAKKKSSNPFRMIGSYMGAGVGLILTLLIHNFVISEALGGSTLNLMFFLIPIGFLLGYGIQLLIRKVRK